MKQRKETEIETEKKACRKNYRSRERNKQEKPADKEKI